MRKLAVVVLAGLVLARAARAGGDADWKTALDALPAEQNATAVVRLRAAGSHGSATGSRAERIAARRQVVARAGDGVRRLLSARGAARAEDLWLIGALSVTAPAATLREIAELPEVERVDLDRAYEVPRLGREPRAAQWTGGAEWNINTVQMPALWALGHTGTGKVIATLDSGADPLHQDLGSRWRGGDNSWYDPNGQHASPYDASGHGTQVLGVLVGGSTGGTAIGGAPGSRWIAAKIFDDSGVASSSDIHLAFQWAIDPDGNPATDDAADVVNCSWGLESQVNQCVLEFQDDIDALEEAGIAVVLAAGNQGPFSASSVSPANDPARIAVGFIDQAQHVDLSSSRGPSACGGGLYPTLVAPGVDVKTADLTLGGVFPDSYAWVTGSSIGAPHVAAGLALLAEAIPAATVANLKAALIASAADLGAAGPDHAYGRGLVDLAAAHARLLDHSFCVDADGDGRFAGGGVCGAADCDDTDASAWGRPAEALGLRFLSDRSTLAWSAPTDAGGASAALTYDVLRSPSAADFVAATACIESGDGPNVTAQDAALPGSGQTLFYLVRARSQCAGGAGTLGLRTGGSERSGRSCP